jgi:hypothetical protein
MGEIEKRACCAMLREGGSWTDGQLPLSSDPRNLRLRRYAQEQALACVCGSYSSSICEELLYVVPEGQVTKPRLETTPPPGGEFRLEQQMSQAAKLLAFLAYVDPKDIWYDLLRVGPGTGRPQWFAELTRDEFLFKQAMTTLARYCLIGATIRRDRTAFTYAFTIGL